MSINLMNTDPDVPMQMLTPLELNCLEVATDHLIEHLNDLITDDFGIDAANMTARRDAALSLKAKIAKVQR